MPFEFLSAPRDLRRNFRRLIDSAEEIEFFITSFDDEKLAEHLLKARQRGAEVNITLTLDARTSPEIIDKLIEAGANVGTCTPLEFKKRKIADFNARVYLFDNHTAWTTAAIVGGFDATSADLDQRLQAATLVESSDFTGKDQAGTYLLSLLKWIDELNFQPLTESMREKHRDQWEAIQRIERASKRQRSRAVENGLNSFQVEVKFVSPLSWQELRRCEWETFFRGLLDSEIQRTEQSPRRITGESGWLTGIDDAQYAFREGPGRWNDPEIKAELIGAVAPSSCLGRIEDEQFIERLGSDEAFGATIHEAIERCVVDPCRGTILHALAPLLECVNITLPDLTRLLAAAAPDRFVSILDETMKLRLSDIVGFDVSGEGLSPHEHLVRYVDAIEQIQAFPWASTLSAERSTDHPNESEAWEKRAALLGCLVC